MKYKYIILLPCLCLVFTGASRAGLSAEPSYSVTAKFVSTTDYSACDLLNTYRMVLQKEKATGLSDGQKANLEMARQVIDELDPPLNVQLRAYAANVAISVDLPSTLHLDRKSFSLDGANGTQVQAFSSDLLLDLDDHDQVVATGNGRASYSITLNVAAFCPFVISGNPNPSIEAVLHSIIN